MTKSLKKNSSNKLLIMLFLLKEGKYVEIMLIMKKGMTKIIWKKGKI